MSMPKNIKAYANEWGEVAMQLTTTGLVTMSWGSVNKARYERLRFYGFRNALALHDPQNPWLNALMETQAVVTNAGDLVLRRSPESDVLRAALNAAPIAPPPIEQPVEPQKPWKSQQESLFEQYLATGKIGDVKDKDATSGEK
jgi:hypothetical protein